MVTCALVHQEGSLSLCEVGFDAAAQLHQVGSFFALSSKCRRLQLIIIVLFVFFTVKATSVHTVI